MDDLRLVENGAMEGKICGHSEFLYSRDDILAENFLAPEQLDFTRHQNHTVDLSRLPTQDEKIDMYKIPAMTNYILASFHESLKERLRPGLGIETKSVSKHNIRFDPERSCKWERF